MGCPRTHGHLLHPDVPYVADGGFPKDRQLYIVSKEAAKSVDEAWDLAYDENIPGRRYVLWRIYETEPTAIGTLLNHDDYYYFECAVMKKGTKFTLGKHGSGSDFLATRPRPHTKDFPDAG